MEMQLSIKDILTFLEKKEFDFSFNGNENDEIQGFSTLFNYKKNTMTFVSSLNKFSDYTDLFKNKKIQLIITDPSEDIFECFANVIQINNPKSIFFSLLDEFFDDRSKRESVTDNINIINKRSFISEKALIGKNVKIGYGCVIEENVVIGDNTEIHHNVVIRAKTKIGRNCTIFSGTIIGESGFNPLKNEDKSRNMIKHFGGVTIEDNVHIGDNSTISRGAIDDTIIKEGVKINKQVVIAHNVLIGKNTVFTAPTFVCGSVTVGENCHIAANVIRNQCNIGDEAVLGLGSVVVKDVETKETVVGNPAKPMIR